MTMTTASHTPAPQYRAAAALSAEAAGVAHLDDEGRMALSPYFRPRPVVTCTLLCDLIATLAVTGLSVAWWRSSWLVLDGLGAIGTAAASASASTASATAPHGRGPCFWGACAPSPNDWGHGDNTSKALGALVSLAAGVGLVGIAVAVVHCGPYRRAHGDDASSPLGVAVGGSRKGVPASGRGDPVNAGGAWRTRLRSAMRSVVAVLVRWSSSWVSGAAAVAFWRGAWYLLDAVADRDEAALWIMHFVALLVACGTLSLRSALATPLATTLDSDNAGRARRGHAAGVSLSLTSAPRGYTPRYHSEDVPSPPVAVCGIWSFGRTRAMHISSVLQAAHVHAGGGGGGGGGGAGSSVGGASAVVHKKGSVGSVGSVGGARAFLGASGSARVAPASSATPGATVATASSNTVGARSSGRGFGGSTVITVRPVSDKAPSGGFMVPAEPAVVATAAASGCAAGGAGGSDRALTGTTSATPEEEFARLQRLVKPEPGGLTGLGGSGHSGSNRSLSTVGPGSPDGTKGGHPGVAGGVPASYSASMSSASHHDPAVAGVAVGGSGNTREGGSSPSLPLDAKASPTAASGVHGFGAGSAMVRARADAGEAPDCDDDDDDNDDDDDTEFGTRMSNLVARDSAPEAHNVHTDANAGLPVTESDGEDADRTLTGRASAACNACRRRVRRNALTASVDIARGTLAASGTAVLWYSAWTLTDAYALPEWRTLVAGAASVAEVRDALLATALLSAVFALVGTTIVLTLTAQRAANAYARDARRAAARANGGAGSERVLATGGDWDVGLAAGAQHNDGASGRTSSPSQTSRAGSATGDGERPRLFGPAAATSPTVPADTSPKAGGAASPTNRFGDDRASAGGHAAPGGASGHSGGGSVGHAEVVCSAVLSEWVATYLQMLVVVQAWRAVWYLLDAAALGAYVVSSGTAGAAPTTVFAVADEAAAEPLLHPLWTHLVLCAIMMALGCMRSIERAPSVWSHDGHNTASVAKAPGGVLARVAVLLAARSVFVAATDSAEGLGAPFGSSNNLLRLTGHGGGVLAQWRGTGGLIGFAVRAHRAGYMPFGAGARPATMRPMRTNSGLPKRGGSGRARVPVSLGGSGPAGHGLVATRAVLR